MMVVACGDTAILVDAGVMFPEPELLGVDLIIPDLRQLQQYNIAALVLTHGHEDHIGAVPHVAAGGEGTGLWHTPLTLALVEAKLGEHDDADKARLVKVRPRDPRDRGCVHDRVHTRDAQHPGLRGGRDSHAARCGDSHRRFQDRSDGRSTASRSIFIAWPSSARRECWRCSPTAPMWIGAASHRLRGRRHGRLRRDLHEREGKIVVAAFASSIYRMQILRGSGGAVRSQGGVCRPRGDRQLRDRAAARLSSDSGGVQIRDSDVRSYSGAGRRLYLHRVRRASRRQRCRGSRSTITGTSGSSRRTLSSFRRCEIPGNERRSARVMNHVAKRGAEVIYEGIQHVHVSGHGSEEELKLMLSLVRPRYFVADTRGVPPARAACPHCGSRVPGDQGLLAENGDLIRFDDTGGRLAGKVRGPAGS